jgi:hypothetical protein
VSAIEAVRAMPRDARQRRVAQWAAAAFGVEQATGPKQRGIRLLEEAVEAYQSAGGDKVMAHLLIDFVFERPSGELAQELGGVAVTLLALANAAGLSADHEEAREIARVLAESSGEFTARKAAKNAAGFDTTRA